MRKAFGHNKNAEIKYKNHIGFVRTAAISPKVYLGDPEKNAEEIIKMIKRADDDGVGIACFPELCLTGASVKDALFSEDLYRRQMLALERIREYSSTTDMILIIGFMDRTPYGMHDAAVVIQGGEIIDSVCSFSNFGNGKMLAGIASGSAGGENSRYFTQKTDAFSIVFKDPFSSLAFAIEVGDDAKEYLSAARLAALGSANIIFNPRAQVMMAGGNELEIADIKAFTRKTSSAYVAADAANGESATYGVYGANSYIAEDGRILADAFLHEGICDDEGAHLNVRDESYIIADINFESLDYKKTRGARRSRSMLKTVEKIEDSAIIYELDSPVRKLCPDDGHGGHIQRACGGFHINPFLPFDDAQKNEKYDKLAEIFEMQSSALASRIAHLSSKKAIIGISGGLDSAAALLAAVRAMDRLGRPTSDIIAVTMPGFATSDHTYTNAVSLINLLGADFKEISIKDAALLHFDMIGQPADKHDLTYENAQARERTQILMDLAGKERGFVIGTGDMSELALGWCTYGGDHMSMYGVNAGIPKTVLQELVCWYADKDNGCTYCRRDVEGLSDVLKSIADTPISPELIPGVQKTEDSVGPYELTDFFIYHRFAGGVRREALLHMACGAFSGKYSQDEIEKWMEIFYNRVGSQQYKRNCAPDGPVIFEVDLMPHGGLVLPSDMDCYY